MTHSSSSTRCSRSTPRNFDPGALGVDGPWSFDTVSLAGARAARESGHDRPVFLDGCRLSDWDQPIGLDSLERFVRHPVRAFLRERLDVSLWDQTREFEDAIPIDLDGLERWEIADRMLQARLRGATWADVPGRGGGAGRAAAGRAGRRAAGAHGRSRRRPWSPRRRRRREASRPPSRSTIDLPGHPGV